MTGYQSKRAAAQDKLDSMEREALKMALEALEAAEIDGNCEYGATEIIREALTQPPQREWIDLTENEIEVIEEIALTKAWAIRMAIAHLKERNA